MELARLPTDFAPSTIDMGMKDGRCQEFSSMTELELQVLRVMCQPNWDQAREETLIMPSTKATALDLFYAKTVTELKGTLSTRFQSLLRSNGAGKPLVN